MENNIVLIPVPLSQLQTIIETAVRNVFASNQGDTPPLLNSVQVKKLCNISHPTLQKWRDNGKIPFTKIDNKILYNKADVLNALYGSKRVQ